MIKVINDINDIAEETYVIMYSTSSCSPCKMLTGILDTLSKDYDIPFYKVLLDTIPQCENLDLTRFNAVPHVEFVKDNVVIKTLVRDLNKKNYINFLGILCE